MLNTSNAGVGIGNNNFDGNATTGINSGDESFVINPESLLTGIKVSIDAGGGSSYSNAPGGTEELYYTVYYADGTTDGPILVVDSALSLSPGGSQESFTILAPSPKLIDAVQLTMGVGTIKIPTIDFLKSTLNLGSDVKLAFTATLTDADGDTATSGFSTGLYTNELPNAVFDYQLAGVAGALDAFNIILSVPEDTYHVQGFDIATDRLLLVGDAGAVTSIDNTGADSIVTITETGGATTSVTVVGVDLNALNIMNV